MTNHDKTNLLTHSVAVHQWKPCGPKCVDFSKGENQSTWRKTLEAQERLTMRNSTHMSHQPTASTHHTCLGFLRGEQHNALTPWPQTAILQLLFHSLQNSL